MPMNNRLLRPLQTPGLLDLVPGAAAAYSLRSLSRSYAGPVVTVRRSSDDAEDSFTATEVADGTLEAFCGAGDGFVYQWWDQSGNGNEVSQSVATDQPKIASSGTLITDGTNPAMQFDGSNDYLNRGVTPSITTDTLSVFAVFSIVDPTPANVVFRVNTTTQLQTYGFLNASGTLRWHARNAANAYVGTNTATLSGQVLASGMWLADDSLLLALNGAVSDTASGATYPAEEVSVLSIGRNPTGTGFFLNGKVSEIIVYPSALTSQRELIEGNIAWSYS